MKPTYSLANMAFQPDNRPVDDYEFTFESYLDDSSRIEPDVCAVSPGLVWEHALTLVLPAKLQQL